MSKDVAIVMYHYVRDLKNSRYPEIKGLDLSLFRQQLEFLTSNFNIITMEKLIESMENNQELPEKSALLTFDDGYADHYTNVFPLLMEYKVQGNFFMPGKILAEGKLLDVNKIHFILASTPVEKLIADIYSLLDYYRGKEFDIEPNEVLYEKLAVAERFDNEKVIFVKRLLQVELEERLRNLIVDDLFQKNIPLTEGAFAKELYMSLDQVKLMKKCGMHFGIHGYDHYWLGELDETAMKKDVSQALDFYKDVIDMKSWTMCYPYGSYSDKVTNYISRMNCKVGLTTDVRIANIEKDSALALPRLDTNDFPPKSNRYLDF